MPDVDNERAPSAAASEDGVSTATAAQRAASHHRTAFGGPTPDAAATTSGAVTPQAGSSAAATAQLPHGATEPSQQQTDPAAWAVGGAGALGANVAEAQPGAAYSVVGTALPSAVAPGSTAAQQAKDAVPPANLAAAGQACTNQPPHSASAAEPTFVPEALSAPVPSLPMPAGESGVVQGLNGAAEREAMPAQPEANREAQTAHVAAVVPPPSQADSADGNAAPREAQAEPAAPADQVTAASAAAAAQAASELLHFEHVAVRGRIMRVPQKLADVVVAGLANHEQHTATIQVTLTLTLTLTLTWTWQWCAF